MEKAVAVALFAVACTATGAEAKTLEDVLKEKGVITEADFREITKTKPVDYKLGKGMTLTAPDQKFQLTLGGRVQTRYTFTDPDTASDAHETGKFEVRRVKFWLNGYAYSKDLTYLIQADLVQGGSSKLLEYAYMNYRLRDEFQVLAGQAKVPFGRQWLNSSGGQQFVDRSAVSDAFRPGYDTGVKVSGDIMTGIATYELGVYGGAGQSQTRTSGDNAYAGRLSLNPLGKMPYSEGDLGRTATPLLSLGGSYYGNTLRKTTATTFEANNITLAGSSGWLGRGLGRFAAAEKVDVNTFGVDAAFKWMGLYAQGEYLAGRAEGKTSGSDLRATGFYGQAGYVVVPKTVEVALRYSHLDPDRDRSDDLITDMQGAVSYFLNNHNLKLQGDVTRTHDQGKGTDDMIYRLQAQVNF